MQTPYLHLRWDWIWSGFFSRNTGERWHKLRHDDHTSESTTDTEPITRRTENKNPTELNFARIRYGVPSLRSGLYARTGIEIFLSVFPHLAGIIYWMRRRRRKLRKRFRSRCEWMEVCFGSLAHIRKQRWKLKSDVMPWLISATKIKTPAGCKPTFVHWIKTWSGMFRDYGESEK